MNSIEHDSLLQRLDALDQRIEARIRQFKTRGEFSDAHTAFVANLKRRQEEIRQRITAKLKDGMSWDLIKTEFERDFDGLYGELLRWEERLDIATMTEKDR